MLYDPRWAAKAEPEVLSVAGLIAWLERCPPETKYDFKNCSGECLLGQYFTARGVEWNSHYVLFEGLFGDDIARTEPHTFAAALDRARARTA